MYGDTDVMRRRARELREQGVDVRALADRLVAQTEAVGWRGRAADALRERVRDRASHLRAAASAHDTAADSLERHLQEVDRLTETIAETERRAHDLIADARTRAARLDRAGQQPDDGPDGHQDGVRVELTDADRTLLAFDPPPPGHRAWLEVDLPGLTAR